MRDPSLVQIVALVAFAGTYLGLALGHLPLLRVDRTGVAIIGAALMAVLLLKSLIPSFAEPGRAWLLVAMAATLAGNLTIVGSVANLIVVEAARTARIEIGFIEYCRMGVPLTIATLLVGWLLLGVLPGP